MPITYNVDPQRKVVVATVEGDMTLEEVLNFRVRMAQDPACKPHYARLIDLRGVTRFPNKQEMTIIAERLVRDPGFPGARRAFVAQTDAVYGTFRMLEQLAEDSQEQWRTFRSADEAELWLMSTDPGTDT